MMTKMFFNEVTINDIGTIAHDFKNSNENCVVGAFDKSWHEGSIWTGNQADVSFIYTKQHFLTPCTMVLSFMTDI